MATGSGNEKLGGLRGKGRTKGLVERHFLPNKKVSNKKIRRELLKEINEKIRVRFSLDEKDVRNLLSGGVVTKIVKKTFINGKLVENITEEPELKN